MKSRAILFPAFLALALAAMPALAAPQPRTVSITGQASIPYKPDFVDLEFAVVTKNSGYAAAQNANLKSVEAAIASLVTGFGMKRDDLTTLEYHLSEEPIYVDGKETGSNYVSSTRMKARVRDLGAYRAIVVALLDAGVNGIDSITFGVDDYASLREKALAAAFSDAERMAKAIAARSGSTLGKALQVSENGPVQTGPLMAKASLREMSAGNGEVISSGTQVVTAELSVEFELR